ncbi:hypothetical protein IAT38_001362 [Cryptococcus sp. DSM 104549]
MPPPPPQPDHHPLRRISTGSLTSLARSTDRPAASPSGLDFLQPAMTDLADEAATLAANISQMTQLHDALGTFNEAFAGYLYALKMNAFCVEWPEAPDETSFQRLEALQRAAANPPPAAASTSQPPLSPKSGPSRQSQASAISSTATNIADLTYATTHSLSMEESPPPARPKSRVGAGAGTGLRKPMVGALKKGGNAALRKKRELEISAIIDTLPLEYRGGDATERIRMEKVINKLMDNPEGLPLKEMLSPPELPQAKVNKCLITLVSKKLVIKPTIGKISVYKWVGA